MTDDLISRQAAIDAMNAKLEDIKLRWKGKVKKGEIAMYIDMRGTIETLPSALPTVDAVPVVRCKDCKHSVDEYDDGECYCDYEKDLRYIKDWDHYCSWAERKEE